MKLASLKGSRDGELIVVDRSLTKAIKADDIAPTMQYAMDHWHEAAPRLRELYRELNEGNLSGEFALEETKLASPLPRAYQWLDGSAYVTHVELVRKARGAELPESFWSDPLMYQGGSDAFIGPRDDIEIADESWGIDLEAEIAVITGDVPMGVSAEEAGEYIRLFMLVNDVSLRNLIPAELAKNFGFMQSKPASAFSPVAISPDELGDAYRDGRIHLPLVSTLNGTRLGRPNAGVDMTFNFPQLIAHAAKTRHLSAGTIIGSGTVANQNTDEAGSSCLAECRMLEKIKHGEPKTPFLQFGDRVQIEMFDKDGKSLFGMIDQTVKQYKI